MSSHFGLRAIFASIATLYFENSMQINFPSRSAETWIIIKNFSGLMQLLSKQSDQDSTADSIKKHIHLCLYCKSFLLWGLNDECGLLLW